MLTHPTLTVEQAQQYTAAYTAGRDWGEGLKKGDVFLGSYGEARQRYTDPMCIEMFGTAGYRALKKRSIWAGEDNIITEIV